jgi:hypothetical protein
LGAASWAVGNSCGARGDGDFLSDVVSGGGSHGGTSEHGNGDNGETHFEYYLVFGDCLVLKSGDRRFTEFDLLSLFCKEWTTEVKGRYV